MFKSHCLPPSLLPAVMSYFCSLTDCLFTCQGCGCCCILWCGVTLLLSPASDLHSSCPLLAECHSTCPLHCLPASCAQPGHLPRSELSSHQPLTQQVSQEHHTLHLSLGHWSVRPVEGQQFFILEMFEQTLSREGRGRRRRGEGEGQQFCLLSSGQFVTFCCSPPSLPPPQCTGLAGVKQK